MKKRIASMVMITLMVVMCMVTGITTSYIDASSVENEYQFWLADYFCENPAFQNYLNNKEPLPYRRYVEVRRNDLTYNSLVASWRLLTFNLSDVSEYSMKEVGYYETILFDILYDGQEGEYPLEDLNGIVESTRASTFKKVYEMYGELATSELKSIDKKSDEFKKLAETIEDMKEFEDVFALIGDINDVLDYCKDIDELITKCAKAQAIASMSSDISVILNDMAKNSNDLSFSTACNNFSKITSEVVTEKQIYSIFVSETAVEKICEKVFSDIWDKVVEECTGYGLAIKVGQELGKSASNMLFSTEEDMECVYSMYALYDFENSLMERIKEYEKEYKKNKNFSNATKYNEAFKLLMKTKLEGIDYSIKYAQITNDQGWINQLFKNFKEKDYKAYMQTMELLKSSVKDLLQFVTTDIYNDFVSSYGDDLREDDYKAITNCVEITKKEILVTEEESKGCVLNISSASEKYYGLDFSVSNKLTKNLETYSDVVMSDYVDLNGHTLTIYGDLIQTDGEMNINNGTLNVEGDYKIQKISSTGVTSNSDGYLNMKKANDIVNIGGDFVTQSTYGSLNDLYRFTAGTMTIKGDFYQYNGVSNNFVSEYNSNHVVIFKGKGVHSAYFDSIDSHFGNVKTEDEATIQFTGKFTGFKLCQDLTIEGNTNLDYGILDLNGYNLIINGKLDLKSNLNVSKGHLNVNGDFMVDSSLDCANGVIDISQNMNVNSSVDLAGGIINVKGSLRHNAGNMNINNGTLNVEGDYKIQKISTTGVTSNSDGYLMMKKANDIVNIGGDFVTQSTYGSLNDLYRFTAGTLIIKGDFYQYNGVSNNFVSEYNSNHVVIFKGKGVHSAYFDSIDSHFGNVKTEDEATIQFTGKFTGFKLCQDLTIEGDTNLDYGILDLNGYNLMINGKLDMKSNLNVRKGHLNVAGDFMVDSGLNCANGVIDISQNMNVNSSVDLAGGTLNVKGNLRHNDGNMNINKGTLNVNGWYKIQKETEAGIVMDSEGWITMKNDGDVVNIGGDFVTQSLRGALTDTYRLTAGTMTIKGDFYQYNGNTRNFICSDSHVILLNGTKKQTIFFESEECKFNILSLNKVKTNYTFSRDECWNKLVENVIECKHTYSSEVTIPATCMIEGVKTDTCLLCGESYTTTIPKIEHSYTTKIVSSTYTEEGYTLHQCSLCGESYKDTYTKKRKVTVSKVKMKGYLVTKNKVQITWKKVSDASGYVVYRYDALKKKWVKIKTISKESIVVYRDKKLEAGKTYKYKVKAYKTINGKKYYGSFSKEMKVKIKRK